MIAGILLAAGAGTRFGQDKLLYRLPDGTPMAVASARKLKSGVDRALAVVRPGARELASLLEAEGLEVVVCPDAAQGMGRSLACGVVAAQGAKGWVIALADMPLVRAETVRAVARRIEAGALLAAPFYQGRRGQPVGFGFGFFRQLAALLGDTGARHLVQAHLARLAVVETDDPGILLDVDTPQDMLGAVRAAS